MGVGCINIAQRVLNTALACQEGNHVVTLCGAARELLCANTQR